MGDQHVKRNMWWSKGQQSSLESKNSKSGGRKYGKSGYQMKRWLKTVKVDLGSRDERLGKLRRHIGTWKSTLKIIDVSNIQWL